MYQEIPKGYELIAAGKVQIGDRYWNRTLLDWALIDKGFVGTDISRATSEWVIRKIRRMTRTRK